MEMVEAKGKHLTIREVKKILRDQYDNLDTELTNKRINFQKTQPTASQIKDIVVDTSHSSFDKFAHYVIKDEIYDTEIISLLESINSYEALIIKRIKSIALANRKEAEVIILREDEKYASEHNGKPRTWNSIGEIVGFSDRQAQRIYEKYLNS